MSRKKLYAMRDAGALEQLSRGLYRLRDLRAPGSPDLVTIAKRVPQGVVCLISALAYHELTTQVPHEVYVALLKGAEAPRRHACRRAISTRDSGDDPARRRKQNRPHQRVVAMLGARAKNGTNSSGANNEARTMSVA